MTAPTCRSCGADLKVTVLDLGEQPLSNAYVLPGDELLERSYPLHARFCGTCYLVQVDDVVAPAEIFSDYAYFSSFSDSWVEHARKYVEDICGRFALDCDHRVVEVASNDGYLLRHFIDRSIPALGIEPAANVAVAANSIGVPTIVEFFGSATAAAVAQSNGHADLIVANNVMAHVPDLNDFVEGLAVLLADDGVATIEVPHLLQMVQRAEFDTIYHEHFSYFSLVAASGVLERHGLSVFDVDELPTHGGSLRIYAAAAGSDHRRTDRVDAVIERERGAGIDVPEGFATFAARAIKCRDGLLEFLERAAASGQRVVGYGAAAKGNTLLNFAGVGSDLLPWVADRNPRKQDRLLPGSHIPIVDPSRIYDDRPDFVLVLPWNIRDEVIAQLDDVRGWGGTFVTAVPDIEVFP